MTVRDDASTLLRRLIACDTSNPPGNETQAVAILEDHFEGTGVVCERVAKDPARANLIARLPGRGTGPSLAFLSHLDVVQARREDWSVEPFAGVLRDGAVWGRGCVDMKCAAASWAVALATLAREGFDPNGDLMLLAMTDEEVGEAGVGTPWFVEQRPELKPDFLLGEGAGERFETPEGPIYLLDCGVKTSMSASLTVRGRAGDAGQPGAGASAAYAVAELLVRLRDHQPEERPQPEVEPLLRYRGTNEALDRIIGALLVNVIPPTTIDISGPANVVPELATVTLQCTVLPGTTKEQLEDEVRTILGDGDYDVEASEGEPKLVTSPNTPLRHAIERFLAERDPEATLVPTLGYGFSDCHIYRKRYGTQAYGFIPFRHADALTNLDVKHAVDERVLVDDLAFQAECARSVAREIGSLQRL